MKIVNRAEFQKIKTCIYSKYMPQIIGPVCIKHNICFPNDFLTSRLFGDIETTSSEDLFDKMELMEKGQSFEMVHSEIDRDGMFDNDQLFVVYEPEDLKEVIYILEEML